MRRFFLLVLGLLCAVSSGAESQRAFTFEDMMKLKRLGSPQISPDGKWVLFSVAEVSLERNSKTPHLWVVPTVGGSEKEIVSDQDADDPHWAPDGKRFLFVSSKEGGAQVWIADFDGATGTVAGTRKLTAISTEVDGPRWSPDGKTIVFASNVYPECDGLPAEEAACNVRKLDEASQSKVKALIFTHLLYRHWNAYKEGKRSHLLVIGVEGGLSRDLTPGDHDAPVFSLGGQDNFAFSPDGQELCYTSNHDPVEATSTNNDLFVVPVQLGAEASPAEVLAQTRNLTADNKASDSTPLYSPDGNSIAYRAQRRAGYESDRFRLMLYNRRTGKKTDLTEGFDHWVGSFVWAPDSRTIYFSAEHKRHSLIYAVGTESSGGSNRTAREFPIRALVGGYNDDVTLTPDGKTLVFSRMSITAPNEIYTAAATGDGCPSRTGNVDAGHENCSLNTDRALTGINQPLLSEISMAQAEPFFFAGAHDDQVEGSLVKPPDFDPGKKYPVKFLVHGGPQGAWGDDWSFRWNAELFAADGYVVVMINFHGSIGYGQKFIDAINGDWGGAPFEDLMKGLDYVEQHYPFVDKDRECALGASYGGYMVNWILGHTDRFRCIVSHDGMFNAESAWGTTEELWFNEWEFRGTAYDNRAMYQKWSPHQYARSFKTPTLVIHGQKDYRLDVSEGLQLFTTLQRLGVPSKMLYFPDEGHWVLKPQNSQLWYKMVNDWVNQWVKK